MTCIVILLVKMSGFRWMLRLSFIYQGSNPVKPQRVGCFPLISVGHSATAAVYSAFIFMQTKQKLIHFG